MTKVHGGARNPQTCMKMRLLTKTVAHQELYLMFRMQRPSLCADSNGSPSGTINVWVGLANIAFVVRGPVAPGGELLAIDKVLETRELYVLQPFRRGELAKCAVHGALWPGKRYMRLKRCRGLGNLGSGSKTKQALKPSGGPPYNL